MTSNSDDETFRLMTCYTSSRHVTAVFVLHLLTMPMPLVMVNERGCKSYRRLLIELYSTLLLSLFFAAILIIWCLEGKRHSEEVLKNGTKVDNTGGKHDVYTFDYAS